MYTGQILASNAAQKFPGYQESSKENFNFEETEVQATLVNTSQDRLEELPGLVTGMTTPCSALLPHPESTKKKVVCEKLANLGVGLSVPDRLLLYRHFTLRPSVGAGERESIKAKAVAEGKGMKGETKVPGRRTKG